MTTFYSDHFSPAIGVSGHFTTLAALPARISVGKKHARVRRTMCSMLIPSGQDLGDDDVIRLLDMQSGDRLIELYFSMDADFGATTTFNVGLYKKGNNNNGAVIDEDLFVSAVDWAGAIARTEYFKESATFTDMDRGKTLWELVTIGAAATYTEDPREDWTLTLQTTQDISATAAAVSLMCEVWYVAGD